MTIDDQIEDEKLQYNVNREAAKISALSSGKIGSIYILLVKKYYLLIKNKQQNKLNLLIFLQEKLLKNKQKQLKIKEKTR